LFHFTIFKPKQAKFQGVFHSKKWFSGGFCKNLACSKLVTTGQTAFSGFKKKKKKKKTHLRSLADATPLAKAVRCHDKPKQPCLAGRL